MKKKITSFIFCVASFSLLAARDKDSIPRVRQTHISLGLGNVQFQDRATSPLAYSGAHLNLMLGQTFFKRKGELAYSFDLGAGALGSNVPKQQLKQKTMAFIGTAQLGVSYLHQLPIPKSEKWNILVGGKLDGFFDVRLNQSLQNASLAYDGLFNFMLATKTQYSWNKTSKKGKKSDYKVFILANAGLLNVNYRPGYNNISMKPLIGDTESSDFQKDKSVRYGATVNGYRFQVEIGLLRTNSFSRNNQISYVFDGTYAPGRYEPYGILFHRLKYTLTLQKSKR